MIKFLEDIIGSTAILFQEKLRVGNVAQLVIDASEGLLVGIVISMYGGKKEKVVLIKNIKGFGNHLIMIDDYDSLSEVEDIVTIKNLMPQNPELIKSRVETESGQKLGRLVNATVDLSNMKIEKIYVDSGLALNLLSSQLIIPREKVVRIEKNKVIVQDSFVTLKEGKVAAAQAATAK